MTFAKTKNHSLLTSVKFRVIVSVLLVLLLFVIFAGAFLVAESSSDRIAKGVYVAGMYLGGVTQEEAQYILSKKTIQADYEITLYTRLGKSTSFYGSDISLFCDVDKTCKAVFDIGRSDNILKDILTHISLRIKPRDFGYICTYDKEKLCELIYNFGISVNGERKNYLLEFGEDHVNVSRGSSGQSRDVTKALLSFDSAIRRGHYNIYIPLNADIPAPPGVQSLYDEIYLAPKDASYLIENGRVKIIPDEPGREIDIKEAEMQLGRILSGETVQLNLISLPPAVSLEDLNRQLFNHTLAQYTTSYSTADKGRSTNVALAARKINGIVLAPGEVFSFNGSVGARTASAGFREAPVYVNGESVQGTGGGICQVSSTLYSAVLYADLEVVSRRNHSMTVAYIPKGQDATVSYGSIDFKFRNNTEYPLKINTTASGGKLTVSLTGTKPSKEKTVKIINSTVSTVPPSEEHILDANQPTGTKKVLSSGKTGYTVDTTRVVYENGVQVKAESMGRSSYKMVPKKVSIGTKATPAPIVSSPTPSDIPASAEAPDVADKPTPEPSTEPSPTQASHQSPLPTTATSTQENTESD